MEYLQAVLQQGRAEEARKVHTLEVGGSIPSPAIMWGVASMVDAWGRYPCHGSIPCAPLASHGLNDTQSCRADRINNF